MPRFNSPVCVVFTSYRYRMADTDGLSGKAVLDALVTAGIFESDTPEEIKEVRFKQTKIGKDDNERTEIEIIEV